VEELWIRGVIALRDLKVSVDCLTDNLWYLLSMLAKETVEGQKVGEIEGSCDGREKRFLCKK